MNKVWFSLLSILLFCTYSFIGFLGIIYTFNWLTSGPTNQGLQLIRTGVAVVAIVGGLLFAKVTHTMILKLLSKWFGVSYVAQSKGPFGQAWVIGKALLAVAGILLLFMLGHYLTSNLKN